MKKLILASTSPQRQQLLKMLGVDFEVCAPRSDEAWQSNLTPKDEARRLAREKALSIAEDFPEGLILGCDTFVVFEGEKIGKPRDIEDARNILQKLRAKTHSVLSAVALYDAATKQFHERLAVARIIMRNYSEETLEDYLATGEALGKAGAYALQGEGAKLVALLDGKRSTVIGLPIEELNVLLKKFNLPVKPGKVLS